MYDSNFATLRASPENQQDIVANRVRTENMTWKTAHKAFVKSLASFSSLTAHARVAVNIDRVLSVIIVTFVLITGAAITRATDSASLWCHIEPWKDPSTKRSDEVDQRLCCSMNEGKITININKMKP